MRSYEVSNRRWVGHASKDTSDLRCCARYCNTFQHQSIIMGPCYREAWMYDPPVSRRVVATMCCSRRRPCCCSGLGYCFDRKKHGKSEVVANALTSCSNPVVMVAHPHHVCFCCCSCRQFEPRRLQRHQPQHGNGNYVDGAVTGTTPWVF